MKRFILLIPLLLCAAALQAAEYRTPNFTVTAADPDVARQVGDQAEACRKRHSIAWLGTDLPKWSAPCPVTVRVGQIGNGGATNFDFAQGQVIGWSMTVQGTREKIISTVIPHEVLHTILACHFRRGIPRWADEGAATYEEDADEKRRQKALAAEVVGTQEQIPIRQLLNLQEYPQDPRKVLVLYAQGFYITEYLIDQKGRHTFVKFLETYFNTNNWDTAFKRHYGFPNQEAAYTAAWRANRPATKNQSGSATASTPVDYNTYHIDYFTQSNCGPCRKFKAEQLPALLKAKNLKVRVLDLDKNYTWERAQQDGINRTPAFIIYRNEKRQAVIQGYTTAAKLLEQCKGTSTPVQTVQARQGVGIGYFGPVGRQNSGGRANPHSDFSAAQLQQLNAIVDQRSQMAIDGTITARLDDLKGLMKSEIKAFVLEAQSKLTDEQKALINATDEQKSIIAGFKGQIEAMEAGKAEFIKQHQAALEEQEKQTAALAEEVKAANTETASVKSKLAALAKEGVATAASGVLASMGVSTPPALAMTLIGGIATFFWNRRKKDELAKQG